MESFLIENRMHHGTGRARPAERKTLAERDQVEARTSTTPLLRLAAQRHKVIASEISQAACFAQQKREQDQSKKTS
jgi:hypothetical protein